MLWLALEAATAGADDGGCGADDVGGVGGGMLPPCTTVALINPVPPLRSAVGLEPGSCTLT
jgi:hypothetical protein